MPQQFIHADNTTFRISHAEKCSMKHTPVSAIKDDVRSEILLMEDRRKAAITISPAALPVFNTLRWSGPIWVVDCDPVVVRAAARIQLQLSRLNIHIPPACLIQDFVQAYVAHQGVKQLGPVDMDLTGSVRKMHTPLMSVLTPLIGARHHGNVYLTINERNDGFHSTQERVAWFKAHLPRGAKVFWHRAYLSDRWDESFRLKPGSNMCVIGFRVG